jgi:hypothetical protein
MDTKEKIMLGTALAVTAALGYSAFHVASNGGFNKPSKQAAPADPLAGFGGHNLDGRPGNVCEPEAHLNGYTYTPHRYPRVTGGEITAVIHRGFSAMRVPADTPDAQWIVAPPSEVIV